MKKILDKLNSWFSKSFSLSRTVELFNKPKFQRSLEFKLSSYSAEKIIDQAKNNKIDLEDYGRYNNNQIIELSAPEDVIQEKVVGSFDLKRNADTGIVEKIKVEKSDISVQTRGTFILRHPRTGVTMIVKDSLENIKTLYPNYEVVKPIFD